MINLYLFVAGGVGSAVAAILQCTHLNLPTGIFFHLFLLLGLTGFCVVSKLVRLRQAWMDSALAMCKIKRAYLREHPALAEAFHWSADTLPPLGTPWTITFNLALMVVVLDSFSLVVAGRFLPGARGAGFDAALFLASCLAQFVFYFYQLPWPPLKRLLGLGRGAGGGAAPAAAEAPAAGAASPATQKAKRAASVRRRATPAK